MKKRNELNGRRARVTAAPFLAQFEGAVALPVHLLLLLKQG